MREQFEKILSSLSRACYRAFLQINSLLFFYEPPCQTGLQGGFYLLEFYIFGELTHS